MLAETIPSTYGTDPKRRVLEEMSVRRFVRWLKWSLKIDCNETWYDDSDNSNNGNDDDNEKINLLGLKHINL